MTLGLSPVPPRPAQALAIPQDVPVYRVKSACYLDDDLYTEGAVLTWPDEPNLEMEPMNELAQKAMIKFLEKLDIEGQKVAEKTGKSYSGYKDAYENSLVLAQQDGKRVQLVTDKKMAPLMRGNKKTRVEKVELNPTTPLTGAKGKHAVGAAAVNSIGNAKGFI